MSEETFDLSSLDFGGGDPSKFPTRSELPLGDVIVEIKAFTAKKSGEVTDPQKIAQGKKGGKLGIAVSFALAEPEEMKGIPHTETFWIGSDDDPAASKPQTWQRNGVRLMNLFKQAGVSVQANSRPFELMEAAKGQKVGVSPYKKADSFKDKETGEVIKRDKLVATNFWKVGTRPVKVSDSDGADGTVVSAPAQTFSNND